MLEAVAVANRKKGPDNWFLLNSSTWARLSYSGPWEQQPTKIPIEDISLNCYLDLEVGKEGWRKGVGVEKHG